MKLSPELEAEVRDALARNDQNFRLSDRVMFY
jgi:hypothetical protein